MISSRGSSVRHGITRTDRCHQETPPCGTGARPEADGSHRPHEGDRCPLAPPNGLLLTRILTRFPLARFMAAASHLVSPTRLSPYPFPSTGPLAPAHWHRPQEHSQSVSASGRPLCCVRFFQSLESVWGVGLVCGQSLISRSLQVAAHSHPPLYKVWFLLSLPPPSSSLHF